MASTNYSCSQPELYVICRKGWDLCETQLPAFTAYKQKYSPAFVVENQTMINAADAMYDSRARYATAQNLRIDLVDKKDDVLEVFQLLKGYIEDAYRSDKAKTMIQAAGQQFYVKSSACNWVSVSAMLSAMAPFVTNNLADLTANNNMPADFATQIQTLKTEFDALYKSWSEADIAAYNETEEKVLANNGIFNNLKTMLADAQKVFRKDEAMALKFTWDDLMAQVRGTRPSGINVKTINGANKKAVGNVKLTFTDIDMVVTTDADGLAKITDIPIGKYTLVIEAEGFETITMKKYEVKVNVFNRLIVKLAAVPTVATV
ncbi:MAG: carboxypeptidase regulatory-like domain-containing protein [Saprospiraceae bacterium]|nr:carboxypeptidase regulatory-like domain-containing protein [Saprospiraceae bacterium]